MFGKEGTEAVRIGQLTEVYKPFVNGVTNFISLHKRVLESWGHRVFVFTLGHEDYEDDELHVIRSPAIPLSDTGYHLSFRLCRRARKKIKTMDVLHVHHPFISGRQAISLGKRYDIPVVFTNHTRYHMAARYYAPFIPDGLSRAFLETYLPDFTDRCDLVVVPSRGVKRALQELGVTCPIEIVPNGVDVTQFQCPAAPLSKRDLGLPDHALVAITVGRLGLEKNLSFLLRAFSRIADEVPGLHLVLIGEGPDRESLEEIANFRGLGSRVHLVGEAPYEEVPNWLAMGDFFAFPSVSESHPLVVLEALASGLPVLGIPCPGVEDTIVDGFNGLLSPEDANVFAAQMRRLATEPDLRARLAAGARETRGQYDIRHTSATLMSHYERLVEERARRQPGGDDIERP
jgi:glycosyltransferase involved in cell wall biosynthesis